MKLFDIKEFKEFTDFVLSIAEELDNVSVEIYSPSESYKSYIACLNFEDYEDYLWVNITNEDGVYTVCVETMYEHILTESYVSKERIIELLKDISV